MIEHCGICGKKLRGPYKTRVWVCEEDGINRWDTVPGDPEPGEEG